MSVAPPIADARSRPHARGSLTAPLGRGRQVAVGVLRVAAAVGVLAYGAHPLLHGSAGFDRFFEDVVFNALILGGALLCLLRACWSRSERLTWLTLAAGLGCWGAGSILYTLSPRLLEGSFPTVPDLLWLVYYPAGFATLGLLVRARTRQFYASLWLDGLVGALVVSALAAQFVLPSILAGTGGSLTDVLANTVYPLGDVLLMAFAVGVLALTGWSPGRVLATVSLSFAMGALADTASLYFSALGEQGPAFVDLLWPASAVLLGWAAWTPTRPSPVLQLEGRRLLLMPIAFASIGLGMLALHGTGPVRGAAYALTLASLAGVIARMALTFSENLTLVARSRREALTDALTGLGNRRRLLLDLDDAARTASARDPWALLLFDLNGFKRYNDTFGHPAGDALLARLGVALRAAAGPDAAAYRLGGDEFCVLARLRERRLEGIVAATVAALGERGDGFEITTACGTVLLPAEAHAPSEALRVADELLYEDKGGGRSSDRSEQTVEVLVQLLREREPELHQHLSAVAVLAREVGRRMGLDGEDLDVLLRAAELHDVGKIAIPDAILQKPARLDPRERAVVERHTEVGDRILSAAAALRPVARLVRSSHERWDGTGYPDRLAGTEIPLAARIVAVCDAFDAMTSDRPYRKGTDVLSAIAELRLHAGTQFDPAVIDVFCDIASAQAAPQPRISHTEQEVPA